MPRLPPVIRAVRPVRSWISLDGPRIGPRIACAILEATGRLSMRFLVNGRVLRLVEFYKRQCYGSRSL